MIEFIAGGFVATIMMALVFNAKEDRRKDRRDCHHIACKALRKIRESQSLLDAKDTARTALDMLES